MMSKNFANAAYISVYAEYSMKSITDRSEIRAFRVLELLDARKAPLRLKDFVEDLAAPTSSTAELLKSMTDAGYLAFDVRTRSYMPTVRVASLGSWVPDSWLRREEVINAMATLSRKCGELIFLGVASDIYVHYTETLQSTLTIRMVVEPNAKRLLVQSGMGWALLSAEPDATIEKIHALTIHRKEADRRKLPLQKVMDQVQQARDKGYIYSRSTVFDGAGVIATRLPVMQHGRALALGIAGPTSRLDDSEAYLSRLLVTQAANACSRSAAKKPT